MRNYNTSRWYVITPLAALCSFGLIGAANPASPPRACELANDWVKAHAGKLPATYAEISKLPGVYRKAVYLGLPPDARRSLWREKLGQYLAPNGGLTEDQQRLVRYVRDNQEWIVSARPQERSVSEAVRLNGLRDSLIAAFGKEKYRDIFVTIGAPIPTQPRAAAEKGAAATEGDACGCSTSDDIDCLYNLEYCYPGNYVLCVPQIIGCGFNGEDSCDGYCWPF